VAVKIRLKRLGKIRAPYYRIVVVDGRAKRDGRVIEEIGKYHPTEDPSFIEVNSERVQYWLSVGAQPTEPVLAVLKVTGDWQKHKGLPGTDGKLKVAAAKAEAAAAVAAAEEAALKVQAELAAEKEKAEKAAAKQAEEEAKAAEAAEKAEEAPAEAESEAPAEDKPAEEAKPADEKPAEEAAPAEAPAEGAEA
jgi:small subunit ribosomal protein S16